MKICTVCKKDKELSEFGDDKRVKSGKMSWCRSCQREKQQKWRDDNKEKVKEYHKNYQKENKENIRNNSRKWRKNNNELIPLSCDCCGTEFSITEEYWRNKAKHDKSRARFCSIQCKNIESGKAIKKECHWCHKDILVTKSKLKDKNFCSHSCKGKYSAQNKNYGIKRSKLEIFIGNHLSVLYPNLKILFNDMTAIGYELDFYFPELKFAIELNGIFHYKPIFGEEKLIKIQNNDKRKFDLCKSLGINILIINTSELTHTNDKTSAPYLEYVKLQLNKLLSVS